jgi:hypothetical protein
MPPRSSGVVHELIATVVQCFPSVFLTFSHNILLSYFALAASTFLFFPSLLLSFSFICCFREIYTPKSARQASVDGAFFGATFPHLFLLQFPQYIPTEPKVTFVPKIFGFKIHPSSPLNKTAIKVHVQKKALEDESKRKQ